MPRTLFVFLFLVTTAAAVASVGVYLTLPRTVTITRTEEGFVPKTVFIRKGDSVRFISHTSDQCWPAADSHPSHNLYPEFDPRRALNPDESWTFTFDRAGVWNFHDHLFPETRGSVFVEGEENESVKNCLAASKDRTRGYCWATEIAATMKRDGLLVSFDAVRRYYESSADFQNQCHDIMHVLGSAAYGEYMKTDVHIVRPETSYCGYGFYHGFMEQMLIEKGQEYLHDAGAYCMGLIDNKALPSKKAGDAATAACFHGIGHALFDSLSGNLWGDEEKMATAAIGQCEAITTDTHWRSQCASGVFNSLSIAEGKGAYRLSYREGDPTLLCRNKKVEYQESCYNEISIGYINRYHLSETSAIALMEQFPGDAKLWSLMAYFDNKIRHNMQEYTSKNLYLQTESFAAESEKEAIVEGVLNAFTIGGKPGEEYVAHLDYCANFLPSKTRDYCYSRTIVLLNTIYTDEKLKMVCQIVPEKNRRTCRDLLGVNSF